MLLSNVHIAGRDGLYDIDTREGRIFSIDIHEEVKSAGTCHFEKALALPGLINTHDHLDFNCFPRLANRRYSNYREWGMDIQANNKAIIDEVLQIPGALRTEWGIYKNLLNGFTTVVNHGKKIPGAGHMLDIFQDCESLHSVSFESNWRWKLNHPRRRREAVAMHVGEGTDSLARKEISTLVKWNLLGRKIIAVHAVSMDQKLAKAFHAITWCPSTNHFLLGATAAIETLKTVVPVTFGTDSTLTASWNAWEQLREARGTGKLTDEELLQSVTCTAAKVWNMRDKGILETGMQADIIIADQPGSSMDDVFSIDPHRLLLVMQKGMIRLFDERLFEKLPGIDPSNYSCCELGTTRKYVWGDIAGLVRSMRTYYPQLELPVVV